MNFEEVWAEFWIGDESSGDLIRKLSMNGKEFALYFFNKGWDEAVYSLDPVAQDRKRFLEKTQWPDPRTEK
jgi:hypothetical protein